MGRHNANPREPKNVNKLISDARGRQVENAVLRWLKGVVARDEQRRGNSGGGTRRKPRG